MKFSTILVVRLSCSERESNWRLNYFKLFIRNQFAFTHNEIIKCQNKQQSFIFACYDFPRFFAPHKQYFSFQLPQLWLNNLESNNNIFVSLFHKTLYIDFTDARYRLTNNAFRYHNYSVIICRAIMTFLYHDFIKFCTLILFPK